MSKRNKNKEVSQMEEKETKEAVETVEQEVETTAQDKKVELEISETATVITGDKPAKPVADEQEDDVEEVVVIRESSNEKALRSENPRVRQFAYQVNQYIALCSKNSTSEDMLVKKLQQFTQIVRSIINSTDPEVYSAAYKFFKEYRNSILSEQTVFQYVHKLPTEMSIRVQTIYTTFKELVSANVDGKPFRLDYGLIRDNMKLPAQHPLLSWIRKRLGR